VPLEEIIEIFELLVLGGGQFLELILHLL
jgi:hypothetical protein